MRIERREVPPEPAKKVHELVITLSFADVHNLRHELRGLSNLLARPGPFDDIREALETFIREEC